MRKSTLSNYYSHIIFIYRCCLDTKIPIIVLTGDPSENERDKCLNILKADSFLVKPVSILQLTGQLSKIFSSPYIEQPLSTKRKNKKVILIVEDETLLNNLVKHFLSDYEVLQAFSVEEVYTLYIYIYI